MEPTEEPLHRDSNTSILREIPLFPLDAVLFPQMVMPLHVFEPRYREMVLRCIEERIPFGVVLIEKGSAVDRGATTYRIGCTARLLSAERVASGGLNIQVMGERRFRLLDTHEIESYRMGVAESLVDDPADEAALLPLTAEVDDLLREFLTLWLLLMGQEVDELRLPNIPELLSFIGACVLPLENPDRQTLLEGTDTVARLTIESKLLKIEIERLREVIEAAETLLEEEEEQKVWTPLTSDAMKFYRTKN